DVVQVDRDAVLGQDDQVLDLVEALELPGAAQQERAIAAVDLADRDVLVLLADDLDDAIHGQVERGDLFLRELDVDLLPQAAPDRDGGDAGDALEAERDVLLGELAQPDAVELPVGALHADPEDGLGVRVELADLR